jgi:hypothetical protein
VSPATDRPRPGASPWVWVTLTALAVLSGVDAWRDRGPSAVPLVQGTLPNLVAVPALTFGFLMMLIPVRRPPTPEMQRFQRRGFWVLWSLCCLGVVVWEFMQKTGNLVFDPLDLVATAVGAGGALLLFRLLEPRSWAPGAPEA